MGYISFGLLTLDVLDGGVSGVLYTEGIVYSPISKEHFHSLFILD